MDELLNMLDGIYKTLEQIHGITINQATILLETNDIEGSEEALGMFENMFEFKEELIDEINRREVQFNEAYEKYRGKINDKKYVTLFQNKIQKILDMKESIVTAEQNNLLFMQRNASNNISTMNVPKDAKKVVAAYKVQQINK